MKSCDNLSCSYEKHLENIPIDSFNSRDCKTIDVKMSERKAWNSICTNSAHIKMQIW